MGKKSSSQGESVATMWGQMVAAAGAGEVVEIADRKGKVVAVMVGVHEWGAMQERLRELEGKDDPPACYHGDGCSGTGPDCAPA